MTAQNTKNQSSVLKLVVSPAAVPIATAIRGCRDGPLQDAITNAEHTIDLMQ
jgi:hypothetical protein